MLSMVVRAASIGPSVLVTDQSAWTAPGSEQISHRSSLPLIGAPSAVFQTPPCGRRQDLPDALVDCAKPRR